MVKKQNLFSKLNKINANADFIKFRESNLKLAFTVITFIGLFIVASWHFIDHTLEVSNKQSVLILRICCILFYLASFVVAYFHNNRKYLKI